MADLQSALADCYDRLVSSKTAAVRPPGSSPPEVDTSIFNPFGENGVAATTSPLTIPGSFPSGSAPTSGEFLVPSAAGMGPSFGKQRRKRRTKAQLAVDRALLSAVKRKRGRPSKSDIIARQALLMAHQRGLPVPQIEALKYNLGADASRPKLLGHRPEYPYPSYAQRLYRAHDLRPPHEILSQAEGLEASLVGRSLSGRVEGTFEAGFFVAVEIAGTGKVLRGVVFGTDVAVPVTEKNDVQPEIRMVNPATASRSHPDLTPPPTRPTSSKAGAEEAPAAPAGAEPEKDKAELATEVPSTAQVDKAGADEAAVVAAVNSAADKAAAEVQGGSVASKET